MLIPFGVFSAAGAGGGGPTGPSDYELISTTVLGSSQASVTFDVSTYASTYKHLQIRAVARSDRAAADSNMGLRFNSDSSASNYRHHYLDGYGSGTPSSGTGTGGSILIGAESGNTQTANSFAGLIVDILDPFSTSKNKTIRALSGYASSANYLALKSGMWMSTSATTTLTLLNWDGANHLTGSRFSLYGLKG